MLLGGGRCGRLDEAQLMSGVTALVLTGAVKVFRRYGDEKYKR